MVKLEGVGFKCIQMCDSPTLAAQWLVNEYQLTLKFRQGLASYIFVDMY